MFRPLLTLSILLILIPTTSSSVPISRRSFWVQCSVLALAAHTAAGDEALGLETVGHSAKEIWRKEKLLGSTEDAEALRYSIQNQLWDQIREQVRRTPSWIREFSTTANAAVEIHGKRFEISPRFRVTLSSRSVVSEDLRIPERRLSSIKLIASAPLDYSFDFEP